MIFVSVTRLRIRALRFMPGFGLYALRSRRQCEHASGFCEGALLADRKLTFWTTTLWQDQNAMRAFMASGAHVKAMPHLMHWCDEASVVHWATADTGLPDWREADRRMRAEGRPSKVKRPSASHAGLNFAEPRTTAAIPIRAVQKS